MSASAATPLDLPPICAMCAHAWPLGQRVLCHCPPLVERFGLQPVRVMRCQPGACDAAQHRSIPIPYIEH